MGHCQQLQLTGLSLCCALDQTHSLTMLLLFVLLLLLRVWVCLRARLLCSVWVSVGSTGECVCVIGYAQEGQS